MQELQLQPGGFWKWYAFAGALHFFALQLPSLNVHLKCLQGSRKKDETQNHSHSGAPLSVHDSPLGRYDWLDKDGIEDTDEQAGGV